METSLIMEKIKLVPASLASKKLIPIFLMSFFLTSCMQIGRIPLDINQQKTINQSKEILITTQKKLDIEELNPNVMYPGAVAAAGAPAIIVGAVFNRIIVNNDIKRMNKITYTLHKNLTDFQFKETMNQELTKKLNTIKWLKLKPNQSEFMSKTLLGSEKRILTNNTGTEGDALIYVTLSYELSRALNIMSVTADVQIYKKSSPKAVLIYQNDFEYMEQLPNQKSTEEYVHVWSKNHAEKARESMRSASQLLSMAIVNDIRTPEIKPNKNQPTNIWYKQNNAAHLEKKIGTKYILRTNLGSIVIANAPLVARKHNWRE